MTPGNLLLDGGKFLEKNLVCFKLRIELLFCVCVAGGGERAAHHAHAHGGP